MPTTRPHQLSSLYYFLYFGAAGAILPYLNLFYQSQGMETAQIGILAALMTATNLLAGPFWSAMADRFQLHDRMLPLMIMMTLPMALFLGLGRDFVVLMVAIFLFAAILAPIVPMADNAVLTILGDQKRDYGKLRVWGSIGWGISAVIVGRLIEAVGMGSSFAMYITLMFLCGIVASRLPARPRVDDEPFWTNVRRFISQKRWLMFLVSVFTFGTTMSILMNYFVLYFKEIGGGEGLFGLTVLSASIGEIPMLFFAPLLLKRFSSRTLIATALFSLMVRAFVYSTIVDPVWGIAAQLLHGPSFALMLAASVNYVNDLSPSNLGASAQSLFGATFFGLGGVSGALIGSRLYETMGAVALFQIAGLIVFIGLCSFLFSEWVFDMPQKRKIGTLD